MTHKHEWQYYITATGMKIGCGECGRSLPIVEQIKRLNATEELRAEDAMGALVLIGPGGPEQEKIRTALRTYYATLKGA